MSVLHGIGDLSRERFVEIYLDVGRREGLLIDPKVDADRFVITDQGQEHDLAPIYERFLGMPERKRRYFLLRALHGKPVTINSAPSTYADNRARVMPRLRSATFLDLARLDDINRGRKPRSRYVHLAGELYIAAVIDGESSMTGITGPMLEYWGVDFETVRRDALDNLARLDSEPIGLLSPGLWMGPWDDSYASSRLLLTSRLRVCEAPIVAVPNRDTLLVADRNNAAALGAMVSLIESVADSGFALSRSLFRLQGDRLHPWSLPTTNDSAQLHQKLCALERVRRYSEQQWLLQEAAGEDWYVPTAELDENSDGSVTSRALWTEGVHAILPRVDRLHLLSAAPDGTSSRLLVADFADVLDLDGVLEESGDLLPRFRTLRFPTDAELEAIAVPVARDPGTAAVSDPGLRS